MTLQQPLSWQQVAALALAGGFPAGPAVTAVSITEPESGRVQNVVQAGQPYVTTGWGLWQITPGDSEPQFGIDDAMLIGINNARAAVAKWRGAGGFTPWTTWVNGLSQPYLPEAEAAVAAVSGLSLHDLNRLVNSTAGQPFPFTFSTDHAQQRMMTAMRREIALDVRDLIRWRMALARMGKPGWIP